VELEKSGIGGVELFFRVGVLSNKAFSLFYSIIQFIFFFLHTQLNFNFKLCRVVVYITMHIKSFIFFHHYFACTFEL